MIGEAEEEARASALARPGPVLPGEGSEVPSVQNGPPQVSSLGTGRKAHPCYLGLARWSEESFSGPRVRQQP